MSTSFFTNAKGFSYCMQKFKKPVKIKVYCNSDTKMSEKFEDGALPGNLLYSLLVSGTSW
jgi:hypothetical protein